MDARRASSDPASDRVADELAAAYQPRRFKAAAISIGWNVAFAGLALASGAAGRLDERLRGLRLSVAVAVYLGAYFAAYCAWNFPVELYFGYLEERQFGLAKEGIRAWAKDWAIGVAQHGVLFFIGSSAIVLLQAVAPGSWVAGAAAALLGLFLAGAYLAADLVPQGLFQFQRAEPAVGARLRGLLGSGGPGGELPPIIIYAAGQLRDFAGGLMGLGNRQVLLLSRSTLDLAGDSLLRFVVLHELGHRRYHHSLLAALIGWVWVVLGLAVSAWVIGDSALGRPVYIAWLGLTLSLWMGLGEPGLAYLGRRLEYQADRFYMRYGTADEMQSALDELCRRNLARTEGLSLVQTVFHPLPSVARRLDAARRYERSRRARQETF